MIYPALMRVNEIFYIYHDINASYRETKLELGELVLVLGRVRDNEHPYIKNNILILARGKIHLDGEYIVTHPTLLTRVGNLT